VEFVELTCVASKVGSRAVKVGAEQSQIGP